MQVRGKLDLIWKNSGNHITLFESRPKFNDPKVWLDSPVAQFRFNDNEWSLYYCDSNTKWHLHNLAEPTKNFGELLDAVDKDQTGIFYG